MLLKALKFYQESFSFLSDSFPSLVSAKSLSCKCDFTMVSFVNGMGDVLPSSNFCHPHFKDVNANTRM